MNNGIVLPMEKISQEVDESSSKEIKIKVDYTCKWPMIVTSNDYVSIHASDGCLSDPIAYSASGVVTEISQGIRSVYKGSRVAVFGIADCPYDAEYIVADERCVLITEVSLNVAALAGIAACYINIIKMIKMPLGSRVSTECKNLPLLNNVLEASGYSLSCKADYIINDEIILKLGANKPGADWGDPLLYSGERTYPHAYISNTIKSNVADFFYSVIEGKLDPSVFEKEYEIKKISNNQAINDRLYHIEELGVAGFKIMDAGKHIPYTNVLDDNVAIVHSDAIYCLDRYAGEFLNRSVSAIVLYVCPLKGDIKQAIFEGISKINEWMQSTPTTVTRVTNTVTTIGYKDGSHATLHLIAGASEEHIELHWGGKSIIIDGNVINGYGCMEGIAVPQKIISASCLKGRVELFNMLFGEEKDDSMKGAMI